MAANQNIQLKNKKGVVQELKDLHSYELEKDDYPFPLSRDNIYAMFGSKKVLKKEKENVKKNYFLIFGITIENSKANKI